MDEVPALFEGQLAPLFPYVTALLKKAGGRRAPCAYKGQGYIITGVDDAGMTVGYLKCGHPHACHISHVELLEPIDKLEVEQQPCKPPPPARRRKKKPATMQQQASKKRGYKVMSNESNEVQVFGYFVFTRQLHNTYSNAQDARAKAAELGVPPELVPDDPEDRTVVSTLAAEMARNAKAQDRTVRKVKAKMDDVQYDIYEADPEDSKKRLVIGAMFWTPDKGLWFSLPDSDPLVEQSKARYLRLKETLTQKDWTSHLRVLFTTMWNGFSARQGGVVYWVAPNEPADLAKLGGLLEATTGLGLVASPCMSEITGYSMVLLGGLDEAESIRKRKMANTTARDTRMELVRKMEQSLENCALDIDGKVKELAFELRAEVEEIPTENAKKNIKRRTAKEINAEKAEKDAEEKALAEKAAAIAPAEPVAAVPVPAEFNAEAAPAPAVEQTAEPAAPVVTPVEVPPPPAPPAPSAPPPPPAAVPAPPPPAPDATIHLAEATYPLKYEGVPAENTHAYSPLGVAPQADCAWTAHAMDPSLYYCWLAGKLYTNKELD